MRFALKLCFLCAATLAGALADTVAPAADTADAAWTDRDTRNANQYIRLLDEDPSAENVLDLLWGLYERHRATQLLVDTYARDAKEGRRASSRIVLGHLLRRQGRLDEARDMYRSVLDSHPSNQHALAALVAVCRELEDFPEAIAALEKRIALLEPSGPARAAARLDLANLLLESGDPAGAAEQWDFVLREQPSNTALRKTVSQACLAAGMPEEAARHLESLSDSPDPEEALAALSQLAQLHEFAGRFEAARDSLRAALSRTHFQHIRHQELFQHLVRLYERFDRLPALEQELQAAAAPEDTPEIHLAHLARFYGLTAQPASQAAALRKLSDRHPAAMAYQEELVRILLEIDEIEEAAQRLARLAEAVSPPPLRLVLLQCETELRRGAESAAEDRLARFLTESEPGAEDADAALTFALNRRLDRAAEDLLRRAASKDPDSTEHIAALVEFLLQRNRLPDARSVLESFAQRAPAAPERSRRQAFAAGILQSAGALAEAAQSAEAALAEDSGRAQLLRLAEVYLQQHDTQLALDTLEKAWNLSDSSDDRIDVDERILAVLQGDAVPERIEDPYDDAPPASVAETLEDILRDPSAGAAPRAQPAAASQDPILDFYQKLAARSSNSTKPEERLRLAWWAFRTGAFADAYPLLLALERDFPEDPGVARLLFELSRATGDVNRGASQLERLAILEPHKRSDHLRRLAELELARSNPERALELLSPLQSDSDLDPSVLETLARIRLALGQPEEARALLERALQLSRGGDRRRILDSLATVFTALGDPDDLLTLSMQALLEEPDPSQRQNLFEIQLSQARRFGLLESLLALLRRESLRRPFDSFLLQALSTILNALGKHDDAFLNLRRAWFVESGPPRLLPALRDAALRAGRPADAVYYQRQLVASTAFGNEFEQWETLVQLLEDSFAAGEAQEVRERVERRFAQDAGVLTRLAESYRREKRVTRALATQRQLNRLRPWDPKGFFAEAELLEACGRPREAAGAYLQVLSLTEQPQEASQSGRSDPAPLPVLSWLPPGNSESDPFSLRLLEQNGLLDAKSVEEISATLSRIRVELQPSDSLNPSVRLRSIHRAAALLRDLGDASLSEWITRWREQSAERPDEALWAFHHAGARDDAWELLQSLSPADLGERFLRFALGLTMGREAELAAETLADSDPSSASRVLLAARAWVWSLDGAPRAGEDLRRLQAALSIPRRSVQLLSHFLAESRGPAEALAAGSGLAPRFRGTFDGPAWARQLASWARAANNTEAERRYLDLAVDFLSRSPLPNTEALWESVLADRLQLAVTAEEFEHLASLAASRLHLGHANADPFRIASIAARWGGRSTARDALQRFAASALAAPAESFEAPSSQLSSDGEPRLLDSFAIAARQLSDKGLWTEARFLLTEILEASPLLATSNQEARASSSALAHLALLWDFESLPYPDRAARLRRHLAFHPSTDERVTLAQELEAHGYAREAIPVYSALADEDPANSARFLGLLRVCREARIPEPAILRLESALATGGNDQPARESLQQHENLARFLALARSESDLRERANDPIQAYADRRTENPYLRELADFLVAEERLRDALPVVEEIIGIRTGRAQPSDPLQLSALSTTRTDDRRFALLLAMIHEKLGDWSRAAEVYSALTSLQINGVPDPEIARRLAAALVESRNVSALIDLGKTCLQQNQLTALPSVAQALASAGDSTAAANLLLMGARRAAAEDAPAALLHELLRLQLQEDQPARLEADFEPLFEHAVENVGFRRNFLKLLLDHGKPHRDRLEPFLEERSASSSRRPLAILALAALLPADAGPADLLERWKAATPASPGGLDEHNLMAGILFETGHPADARAFYESHLLPVYRHGGMAQPLYLRILLALDDRDALRRFHSRLLGDDQAFNVMHAEMFHQEGLLDEAIALAEQQSRRDALRPPPDREFEFQRRQDSLEQWASLLMEAGKRPEAEAVLRRLFHRGPADIDLLVQLYAGWPEAGAPRLRIQPYHLPPVLEQIALAKIAAAEGRRNL